MAVNAQGNETANATAPPHASDDAHAVGTTASGEGTSSSCSDTSEAFSTIAICTGSGACASGVAAGTVIAGGLQQTCELTVRAFGDMALRAGCPIRFLPPGAGDDDSIAQ
eukprot:2317508-Prymnesium_polylepis.1